MKKKLIIDTDPGIDDALAILYALNHPKLDVRGLTSVYGNVSVDQATTNALRLIELAGVETPVFRGAAKPLVNDAKPYPDFVHGSNGFGDIELWQPKNQAGNESAAAFIVSQIREAPGEIYLLPIGPLTNIALALELAPDIAEKTAGVVLMGGAAYEPGNVTPVAEANIWNDPHAAELVFAANWPVSMIGLDVTHKVTLEPEFFDRIEASSPKQGGFLNQIHQFYLDFYATHLGGGNRCCAAHDALAAVALVEEQLLDFHRGAVAVSCEGITTGQTLFAPAGKYNFDSFWKDRPMHKVALGVSTDSVIGELLKTMAKAD